MVIFVSRVLSIVKMGEFSERRVLVCSLKMKFDLKKDSLLFYQPQLYKSFINSVILSFELPGLVG